ncbi:MAG: imidazole glycerol phosphate synthase subunit HisH [Deltaproteobacteria bacterium]|nr:imidazole glycerol phosphate synthase subunit HisH [Deltaproteobacteria bacterium]
MGNPGSIRNMFGRLGVDAPITSERATIQSADKLVLPGVGAFDHAVRSLHGRGLWDLLNDEVTEKRKPILGICLGAQLLTARSEEGVLPGFGWLDAETVRFRPDGGGSALRIPHMGWNTVTQMRPHPLFEGMFEEPRFYFVHSYHIVCRDQSDVLATTSYGIQFASAVSRGNICGTQFHPEKSHKFGMKVLENFARI